MNNGEYYTTILLHQTRVNDGLRAYRQRELRLQVRAVQQYPHPLRFIRLWRVLRREGRSPADAHPVYPIRVKSH